MPCWSKPTAWRRCRDRSGPKAISAMSKTVSPRGANRCERIAISPVNRALTFGLFRVVEMPGEQLGSADSCYPEAQIAAGSDPLGMTMALPMRLRQGFVDALLAAPDLARQRQQRVHRYRELRHSLDRIRLPHLRLADSHHRLLLAVVNLDLPTPNILPHDLLQPQSWVADDQIRRPTIQHFRTRTRSIRQWPNDR